MTEQKHFTQQGLTPSAEAAASAEIRTLSLDEVLAVAGGPVIDNDPEK
ncbi:hypothetical protein [Roseateles sp.]|jgi:hypothetical protein